MQYTSKQGRIQNRVCIKYTNRIRESQNLIRFSELIMLIYIQGESKDSIDQDAPVVDMTLVTVTEE